MTSTGRSKAERTAGDGGRQRQRNRVFGPGTTWSSHPAWRVSASVCPDDRKPETWCLRAFPPLRLRNTRHSTPRPPGQPFTYSNWRTGEPNNAGSGELYLHYQSVNVASVTQFDSWGWNDMPNERRGYFIECSAPVPEPSLLMLAGMAAAASLARQRRPRW